VTDNGNGDIAGQLSMVDTTHCNGPDPSGCAGQAPPTTPMRRAPFLATLDPATHTLYVGNFGSASLSLIDTNVCNARTNAGCPAVPPLRVVGSGPYEPALDPGSHTIYVPNFYDGSVSLVATGS
jgi:DNA-binding beta-propeller fold protein YncE